jgi:hypothetical protein
MRDECFDVVAAVNQRQIDELEKAGKSCELKAGDFGAEFAKNVRNLEAAVRHTYQIAAWMAGRELDSRKAALLWKTMDDFCDQALKSLKQWQEVFPNCGTPELYDLTLDYKNEAYKRYSQNLQDADECLKNPPPHGLFPKTI